MTPSARVEETRFRGAPAVELAAGELTATFLPRLGMTGVSLRLRGVDYLALPGGLEALRAGRTLGLPLLAPWANRLADRQYRAAGVAVDLRGIPLTTDDHGLPIHGFLVGARGWSVDRRSVRRGVARVGASIEVDARAFPFRHRIELAVRLDESRLRIDTTVVATGSRPVPVALGWHPYLRLPDRARSRWRLRLPARTRLVLDDRGIPTGESVPAPAENDEIGRRTLDDLSELGRGRRLALEADDGSAIELKCGANFPFAQVWVPRARPFAALEPMTAPTNALETGSTPLVPTGESLTARFSLVPTGRDG